jgi:hypothetical protein
MKTDDFKGKKFAGKRKLNDIIEMAKASGWEVDLEDYNKGDDWIWLRDMYNRCQQVKFNTTNGHFYVWEPFSDKPVASHLSVELDNEDWYNELLNLFYVERIEEK